MAKRPMGAVLAAPMVDPSSPQPLYQQVYQRIRELILEGKLPRGARLPSSRTLADDLSLSRNTILDEPTTFCYWCPGGRSVSRRSMASAAFSTQSSRESRESSLR